MDQGTVSLLVMPRKLLELASDHQVLETIVSDVHLIEEPLQHKGFTLFDAPKVSEGEV